MERGFGLNYDHCRISDKQPHLDQNWHCGILRNEWSNFIFVFVKSSDNLFVVLSFFLFFFFLLIEQLNIGFLFHPVNCNSSQMYWFFACLKSIKAACFDHFLGPISIRTPWGRIKIYFSPVNLACVNFVISSATRTQKELGGNPFFWHVHLNIWVAWYHFNS